MKPREKIIIISAVASMIAYLVYALLPGGTTRLPTENEAQQLEATHAFVPDMSKILTQDDTLKADTYILTQAATEWRQKPFLVSEKPIEADGSPASTAESTETIPFRYTGYLEAGDKKLAVINGMEYEVGEGLAPGGYVVKDISLAQVIVEKSDDRTAIMLPLDEAGSIPSGDRDVPEAAD